MRLPRQAGTVLRNVDRARARLGGITPQGCPWYDWLKCGAIVLACAAACVITDGEACIECMGPSYDSCKECL
jgi:polyferredoxin